MGERDARAATGRAGEELAARYLERQGCTILARNWRAHPHEIDIVARDREGSLAFVEVRTRHGRRGLGEESISRRKATSLALGAYSYMAAHALDPDVTPWRIDLVSISPSGDGTSAVNWIRGAIGEEMVGREGGTW